MLYLIKNIEAIEPYKISLRFNTGEVKEVDFTEKLKEWSQSEHSKYKQLLDPHYFSLVHLNTELETIYWDNGIDFCPDTLYHWAK